MKEFVRTEDGRVRRKFFNIILKGKITATKGSPRSNGTWWDQGANNPPPDEPIPMASRLTAIQQKQGAIQALFNNSGRTLEIQPLDGMAPWKCNPRVKNVEFQEGKWFDTCEYTITMEADNVFFGNIDGGGGLGDVQPEESWSTEVDNQNVRTYRVSHTVSSQQKATFDENGNIIKEGWQNAKTVVDPYLGTVVPPGALPPLATGNYFATNYTRSQQVDYANGRYSVTENYVYTYGQRYVEEFSVETKIQEGFTRVTVAGTLTGYAVPNPTQTVAAWQAEKYAQALTAYQSVSSQVFQRAQNYSGVSLNPVILNYSVGKNPITGVVTYNYELDDRPTPLVAGSLSETLSINDEDPTDLFASLVVLGRQAGPILQDIKTKSARVRSVSLEVVMPPWIYGNAMPSRPDVSNVLAQFYPANGLISKNSHNWTPKSGRYSRNIAWTYE